ncbi:nesprin-2-like [Carcharodon carcharias]|uniref:nesprin-2-like n=1 Tax=Carcharodon carcharias TaxID=13397 RepID=UPI001B7EA3D5|nr:nesprin-2-like [Carcharodon carcharias]
MQESCPPQSQGTGRMLSTGGAEEGVDINSLKGLLQAEHEQVQNRTFTNWVNAQLAKHKSPSVIQDLFQDLRDGHILLDLLEVLSGQQMERERGRSNPVHWRSNIETALKFLRKKSIKLVNINVPDIVEGKPTIILGLIWSIILHFHIEKLTRGLQSVSRQTHVEPPPGFKSSPTAPPSRKRKAARRARLKMSAKKTLLQWVQEKAKELGINVQDFSSSWRSGLAFVAIINALRPGLLDPQEFKYKTDKENLEMVFKVAEQELKIPKLLEVQDVDVSNPDEKSMITYVSQFLQYSEEQLTAKDEAEIRTQSHCLVSTEALGARPEHWVSEDDVKRDFEESRIRIDACIEGAMLFLKDRGSPEEVITKHQETLKNFDSGTFERFLEATDKIKTVLTPQKKQFVEEMREQVSQNWEVVCSAVKSQLLQMKFKMEHNKFTEALEECRIQLGMDSSPLQPHPAGHQMFFCEGSSLTQAEQHLAVMRQLCESMSNDRVDAETIKAELQACDQCKTELDEHVYKRLSWIHGSVGSPVTGLRSLNDLNAELQSKATELSELRVLTEQLAGVSSAFRGEAQEGLHAAEKAWEETERDIHDCQDQCCVLVTFLREFQNYKKELASTIQKGEHVTPGSSSYLGKEKLQRLMSNIEEVKLEFSSQQEKVDELRKICRHLQSELRKFIGSGSLPFQREVDELLDGWLDVSERLDAYSSSLELALSLWEDLAESGSRMEDWVKRCLETLRASVSGRELTLLEDEIQFQEQEIQSFHEKAVRIQELLEWEAVPLEFQVVESTVRKKMEQVKHIKDQLSTRVEEPSGGLAQSRVKIEPMEASVTNHSRKQNLRSLRDPQGGPPASGPRVRGQQGSPRSLGEHEELVQSTEDPSDDEITPTAEELSQAPCVVPEQIQEQDTDPQRRKDETIKEGTVAKRHRESQLVQTEGDQSRQSAAKNLPDSFEMEQEDVEKYPEKLREYVTSCRQLSGSLDTLETALKDSAAQIPMSYKAAIEQVERQAALGREISSLEMKMLDLRERAKDLERMGEAGSEGPVSQAVSGLWDHWLCLQGSAREQEFHCTGLRQEWKTISEQIDRAIIVQDHLPDDLPEGPREQATKAELLELEKSISHYHCDLKDQQSALAILLCRVTSVLGVQEASDPTPTAPVLQELRAMEGRCRSLEHKIEKSQRDIEEEVQEREKTLRKINSIGDWLQQATSQLEKTKLDSDGGTEAGLEQLRDTLNSQRQAMAEISDRLQSRYSERYTSIPAEINTRIQETSRALGDMEAKLQALGSQNTRSQELNLRIAAIRSGLQSVEKMLQQSSKSHSEAKAQQKRIWSGIDKWHSVLSQLDAEVQELAEQDPEQAQELMESLLEPFQQQQHVSRMAEQRTALLNKIPESLEEYRQITDSASSWSESAEDLLCSKTDYSSAKSLSKQLLVFQVMAESGRQKQNTLQDITSRLKELSVIYQTDKMKQRLGELQNGVSTLQQTIDQKLTEIKHIATEVGDIESEVKFLENKLSKINTILSSVDLCDLPIQVHLENNQVIVENLEEMKALVGVMMECKESLGLPEEVICTVEVFTKVERVSIELNRLQELTTQQGTLLQSLLEKLQECDTEMEMLQQVSGGASSMEAQCERLANLTERRDSLLNNTQEALTQLVQDELSCEQPVTQDCGQEEQSSTTLSDQPRDSKVTSDGKLPSLMEEEDNEEDENIAESVKRSRTPVPSLDSSTSLLEDLNVCWDRAVALERWLDTAQELLGVSGGDWEMQRDVEEHLQQSQRMLLEIEQKISQLAQAGQEESGPLSHELELLSLRLGTLKCSLVTFQAKLQDIQSEEQGAQTKGTTSADGTPCLPLTTGQPTLPTIKPRLSRQDSLQQQKELEAELSEYKHLTEYVTLHGDRVNQQIHNREEQEAAQPISSGSRDTLPPRDVMAAEPQVPTEVTTNSDQVAAIWQHLQREMEGRLRLLEDSLRQGLGSQVSVAAGTLCHDHEILSTSPPAEEELKLWMTQLRELVQETATIAVRGEGDINQDERLKLEKSLQDAILGISCWSDAVERGMPSYRSISIKEAEKQQLYHQLLAETLERVDQELGEQICLLCQGDVPGDRICPPALEYLVGLQKRLKLLQSAHSMVSHSLRDGVSHITQYQARLRQFEATLLETRTDVQKRSLGSASQSPGEKLQLIEKMECDLDLLDVQLLALISEGEQYDVELAASLDVYPLTELLDGTRRCVREQRAQLWYSILLAAQYQCLVQGLSGLVNSGQEMVTQEAKLRTNSIGELRSHLQNYKLFFCRLANHLILAEQFSQNIPEPIVTRNWDLWLELVAEVSAVQPRALLHGVQMETALQAWTEFEVDHSFLMKEMEMLNSAVPSIGLVEETEERLAERLGNFERIRSSLDGNQARVDQALRKGKALLDTVSSPELEAQLSTLEESWLSFGNQVNHELHRLEMLLEHQTRFQREHHEVGQWMGVARSRLRYWEQESTSLPPKPEISRNQLQLFVDFWKEVDGMTTLKTAAISTGSQLLGLKQAEGGALRTRLTQLEHEWAQLITRLPGVQEKLHQLQMEVLPSRQAISQLSAWIGDVETSIQEDEAEVRALDSSARVKLMLQKYKDYQMEVSCRQLTVDFVNQSVLQMSSQDVESDRYEKTDFAECLGALNFLWQRLTRNLNRKMLDLEMLLESWTEYEHSVKSFSSWLEAQGEQLGKDRRSHTAVINALSDCQELGESLKGKEMELERLRHSVPLVTGSSDPESHTNITKELDQLSDSWRNLDSQVSQVESILTSQLQLWTTYQDSYEEVNGNILRARYSLEHCTPLISSLESVRAQVETLQALQDTLECGADSCRIFQETSQRLSQECSPPLAQQLEQKCEDTHSRWIRVNQDITEQLHSARTLSLLWQQLSDMYRSTMAKVQCREERCRYLVMEISAEDSNQEKLQTQLVEVQESMSGLRTLQEELSQVCVAADELAKQIDSSSSAALRSDSCYLSGKVSCLEGILSMKIPDIQELMEQHEDFQRCLHSLETLVNESEQLLKSDSSSREEAEHSCMEIMMDHLLRLSSASLRLETLKHLSYQLPLSDLDYRRVQALNQRWEQARATAWDRCRYSQHSQLLSCCLLQHRFTRVKAAAQRVTFPDRFQRLRE